MVPIRTRLHSRVRAVAIAEVHELLDEHGGVLPGKPGYRTVRRPAAGDSVAGGALHEVLSSAIQARCSAQRVLKFLLCVGGRKSDEGYGRGQ